jgi:hypothetical protein
MCYGHFKCRPIKLVEALEGLDEEESRRKPDRTAPAGKRRNSQGSSLRVGEEGKTYFELPPNML